MEQPVINAPQQTYKLPEELKGMFKRQEETPAVQTPAVETPVETPVVATPPVETPAIAETPVVETPNWWETNTEQPQPSPEITGKAVQDAPSNDHQSKAAQYDKLMADEGLAAIIAARSQGKNIDEIIRDFQTVDYNSMPAEAVARSYGKLKGWNEDQINEEIGALAEMRPSQREFTVEGMVAKLNAAQADALKQKQGSYGEQAAQAIAKAQQAEAAHEKFIQTRFVEDMAKAKARIMANEFAGAKLTQEDADDFERFVTTEFEFLRKDGTYDMDRFIPYWLGAKKLKSIQRTNYANGKSDGNLETLKEIHRPSESSAAASKLPEVKTPLTQGEKALKAAEGLAQGKFQVRQI